MTARYRRNSTRCNAVGPPGVSLSFTTAFGSNWGKTSIKRTTAFLRSLESQWFRSGFLVGTTVNAMCNLGWVRTDRAASNCRQNTFTAPDLLLTIANTTRINATAVCDRLFRCYGLGSAVAANLCQYTGVANRAGCDDFDGGFHFSTKIFTATGGHSLVWGKILSIRIRKVHALKARVRTKLWCDRYSRIAIERFASTNWCNDSAGFSDGCKTRLGT